jgi:tetratricopeptide (TPR) repeat protein
MTGTRQRLVLNVVVLLLLCGAVWATFGRATNGPFFFDDRASFVQNETLRTLWPLSGPLQPPREHPFSSRPLVNLSAAVNYQFGELDPAGYRIANMALHAASAMLLFSLVCRTLKLSYFDWLQPAGPTDRVAAPLAFAVAVVWAVHPLQTEAVCYLTQRTELMMGLFYLATLYCSLRYWQTASGLGRVVWLTLAIAACAAGMASKEVMVSAPIIALLFERTFVTHSFHKAFRDSWPLYVGLCLTWILLAYLVADAPRARSAGFHLSISTTTWWWTQAKVFLMYLRLAFWPWPLSIHYQIPYIENGAAALPWLMIVGFLGFGTLLALWRGWAVGFLGACVYMILAPTSLVPIISEVAAERRMYLPLAAIAALVIVGGVWLLAKLSSRAADRPATLRRWSAAVTIAFVALAGVLAVASHRRLDVYRSEVALWQDVVGQYPESEVAHLCLALALSESGEYPAAEDHFHQAMRLDPRNITHRVRYAQMLKAQGRSSEAMEQFREVVLRRPVYPGAHFDLGVLLKQAGELEEASEHLAAAVHYKPDVLEFRNEYIDTLKALGDYPQAIEQLQDVVGLRPDDAQVFDELGVLMEQIGQWQEAAEEYAVALSMEPDEARYHLHYGNVLRKLGRHRDAVEQLETVQKMLPDSRESYFALAQTYEAMGQHNVVLEQYERLLKLYPDDADGHLALGHALFEAGRYDAALAHFERAEGLAPDRADTRFGLGMILLELGRNDEAIAHLEESVQIDPDSAESHFRLAEAYGYAERTDEALPHARRALELAQSAGDLVLAEQVATWLLSVESPPIEEALPDFAP